MPEHFGPWLARALSADIVDAGRPSRLTLLHLWHNGRSKTVSHWPLGDQPVAAELAAEVWSTVCDHASAFPGRAQLYEVVVHYGPEYAPYARMPVRVSGPTAPANDASDDALRGELVVDADASLRGLLAQMMRHLENRERLLVGTVGEYLAHDRRLLADKDTRIAELEQREVRVMDLAEKLRDRQHERDMEIRRASAREKQTGELIGHLKLLVPTIANRIAGKTVMVDAVSGAEGQIKALLQSLEPSQLNAILGALNPAQQQAVFTLARIYLAPEAKSESDAAKPGGAP
uniref:hypothetical protein n=1 Tax=Sandaracinus sp. TaxID=2024858 RepID=UPI0019D436E4|nr:hypothetical protein [Sandaracinus sp.]